MEKHFFLFLRNEAHKPKRVAIMRTAFLVPYFGKFNNYFNLVLACIRNNNDGFDWIFFTDDKTDYDWPENSHVYYMTFERLREIVQQSFPFEICLSRPYKLCDYKPAYGYIFRDYITGYDFWGHCDIDCLYGNLSHFINENVFGYDKILRLGHMTLYRNTEENNRRFMDEAGGVSLYKSAFQTNDICFIDEDNAKGYLSIEDIWKEHGYSEKRMDAEIANIWYKGSSFRVNVQNEDGTYTLEKSKRIIFYLADGCLTRMELVDSTLECKEYIYIHLMARKMKNNVKNMGMPIKIIPNEFSTENRLPRSAEEFRKKKWRSLNFQYIRIRSRNLKTKIMKHIRKNYHDR